MPHRSVSIREGVPGPIQKGFARLKSELDVPGPFSDEVLAEAERAASEVVLPEVDRTDIPFVAIDPPGSTDLDQAVFIERDGDGYTVYYAIADLMSFVEPGGAIDAEAHRRGVTLYAPHERTPLHPPAIAEGRASLLAGQDCPALLWVHKVAADGEVTHSTVSRVKVRNRLQITYEEVQNDLDNGTASEVLVLLREVGLLREQREIDRGGVSLRVPSQEVHADGRFWQLSYRASLPCESWNAHISLMTGMAAAKIMMDAGVGILRTLPPAEQWSVDRLRRIAKTLKIRWPGKIDYPEFIRGLDPENPKHAAMMNASVLLFRGAGYESFDGEVPDQPLHGAMNAPYAHCTAPLRRLVDRYVSQICLSVCEGKEIPAWVRDELDSLPEVMEDALKRSNAYERGIVALVEALVLNRRIGDEFTGTVIWVDPRDDKRAEIQLEDPAVSGRLRGTGIELGTEVKARLATCDLMTGEVEFELVGE